jgi:hypothetical protein
MAIVSKVVQSACTASRTANSCQDTDRRVTSTRLIIFLRISQISSNAKITAS